MERTIQEQVGGAVWESWPVGARMAIADAQATIAALQARVQELRKVIERVAHHGPIMGSRGEYRQGQLDVLESVRRIVQEELYGSHQITG